MNAKEAEALYHRMVQEYTPSIYNYFCSWRLSPEEAEDLTQETFLEAWKSLRSFRHESAPKTWLIKIGRRVVWKYTQRRSKRKEHATGDIALATTFHAQEAFYQEQERRGQIQLILSTLSSLSQEHQEMLHLHYLQGLTEQEMAEVLAMSRHTIHSRLGVARKSFRALYREASQEAG